LLSTANPFLFYNIVSNCVLLESFHLTLMAFHPHEQQASVARTSFRDPQFFVPVTRLGGDFPSPRVGPHLYVRHNREGLVKGVPAFGAYP
jgi:hypothetical protein